MKQNPYIDSYAVFDGVAIAAGLLAIVIDSLNI